MESLPWQVAYGQWIGWTTCAVLVVLGCALLWLWVRWVARRRGRASLEDLGNAGTQIVEGPVVLRGTLEIPGAPVPALDGSGAAAACTVETSSEKLRFAPHRSGARKCFRAPSLHIITPDGNVTLRGAVLVTRGSRETFPGALTNLDADDRERLTSDPDDVVAFGTANWPDVLRVPGMIRTVRHGDEVVVRGVVQRNLGNGGPGASYRPMESFFELVAAENANAIEVAATQPGVLSFGKAALLSRGLAVGVVIALAVGVALGGSALRVGDFATAALFPPQRAWAIDELAREAAASPSSEATLATVLAYDVYTPNCRRTGEALLAHGRWKEAGEALEKCHDADARARAVSAYRMAGALGEACLALGAEGGNGLDEAVVHVLGGCMQYAATALRRSAGASGQSPDRTQTLRCIADAIDARGGAEDARKRLAEQDSEACRLAYADLLAGPARAHALAYLADAPASARATHRHQLVRNVLASETGDAVTHVPLPRFPKATEMLTDPTTAWVGRAHGLEHEALKTLAAIKSPSVHQRELRRALAIREAAFETIAGNGDDAARLLELADADVAALSTDASHDVWLERLKAEAQITTLRTLGLLLKGDVDGATAALDGLGDLTPSHFLADRAPDAKLPEALSAIRSEVVHPLNDAAALAAAARGTNARGTELGLDTVLALLATASGDVPLDGAETEGMARLRRKRSPAALPVIVLMGRRAKLGSDAVDWLRYEARTPNPNPVASMWEATLAAHAARALGAPALAERHHQAAQAYRNALLQRQSALFFALLPAE